MDRRELMELVLATGLLSIGTEVLARQPENADAKDMTNMPGMGGAKARPGEPAMGTHYGQLVADTSRCVDTAEACLAHCIGQLTMGNTEMKNCALTAQDVISACTALRELAVRNAPRVGELAGVCGRICRDCEAECKKHEEHLVCRTCRDSCAACAKECERIAT